MSRMGSTGFIIGRNEQRKERRARYAREQRAQQIQRLSWAGRHVAPIKTAFSRGPEVGITDPGGAFRRLIALSIISLARRACRTFVSPSLCAALELESSREEIGDSENSVGGQG